MAKDPFKGLEKDDPFAEAEGLFEKASSSFEKITDYEGRLLMAKFVSFEAQVDTAFGLADAVDATVVVLDGEDAPLDLGQIKVFQKVIVGQLKGKTRPVLGVLAKRPSQKKGMSPAWVLDSDAVTPEQVKLAKEYLVSAQQVDLS
jgi:hypothetical protein